jgi:hypothetical protein
VLRTNVDRLVKTAVIGQVTSPMGPPTRYRVGSGGVPFISIGMSGVVYNVLAGDPAFGWAGDHTEPAVSIDNPDHWADHAMHYLTCVGNAARVVSGEAAGACGVVTGEHARLLVDFPAETLELLTAGDQIQIEAFGTGLELLDYPSISVRKLDPELLDKLNIREGADGTLEIGVSLIFPNHMMASAFELNPEFVDQDITTNDRASAHEYGIDRLRLGDLVAIVDADHTWGRQYQSGAVTIGLINHADSPSIGHGPGCMTLLSCTDGKLKPFLDPDANIAAYLGCGRAREGALPRSEGAR